MRRARSSGLSLALKACRSGDAGHLLSTGRIRSFGRRSPNSTTLLPTRKSRTCHSAGKLGQGHLQDALAGGALAVRPGEHPLQAADALRRGALRILARLGVGLEGQQARGHVPQVPDAEDDDQDEQQGQRGEQDRSGHTRGNGREERKFQPPGGPGPRPLDEGRAPSGPVRGERRQLRMGRSGDAVRVELDAQPRRLRDLQVAVLQHHRLLQQVARGARRRPGGTPGSGSCGCEAAKCTFTAVAIGPGRVVRRDGDVVRLGDGGDLLHLQQAAADADVRLDDVRPALREQVAEPNVV